MGERRVTGAAVQRVAERLSERDRSVLADVARVRVLTGRQVERLHFCDLAGRHRDRTRRRVLERLTSWQLLTPLERRIGGARAGSAGLMYALGPAGQRLLAMEANRSLDGRARHPGTPTDRFLLHNLTVAELYVALVEASHRGDLAFVDYRAEPACWWRSSEGEWIKPDALAVVANGEVEDSWAIEVDMATESLPTLRRKLTAYLNLALDGEHGPGGGPLPRVLVAVPDEQRLAAVRGLVRSLPEPAEQLLVVTIHDQAAALIHKVLKE